MYYLQSRYYDSSVGRFLTADKLSTLNASPFSLTDKNLFAYCDNNPVMRKDDGGMFWDTVFDVVSLAFSVAEVVVNPADPWAWAGMIGDVVDLIPFVSGVGEVTKAISTSKKLAEAAMETADNVHDAKKLVENGYETVKASTRSGAVRKAWKIEFDNVQAGGTGVTRDWTDSEITELLTTGKVKGYQGHHMKSVKGYPELAGDPTNIQFLTRSEHLRAHRGNFRNITHGWFNYRQ